MQDFFPVDKFDKQVLLLVTGETWKSPVIFPMKGDVHLAGHAVQWATALSALDSNLVAFYAMHRCSRSILSSPNPQGCQIVGVPYYCATCLALQVTSVCMCVQSSSTPVYSLI